MFQTLYVGRLLGIKVYIHWTFWFLAIYIVLSNLDRGVVGALSSLGFVFAVFGCVFLHEMGHAVAAKSFRIQTLDITLLPIGGVARMGDFTRSPLAELVVALAGPLVNVVIAASLLLGLSIQASFSRMNEAGIVALGPLEQLLIANVALAVFNMLPSFPMDGGRVLRSLLAMTMPYSRATMIAARTGQVMAVLMFCFGLYFFSPSLLLISVMVFAVCTGELIKERFVQSVKQMGGSPMPFDPQYPQSSTVEEGAENTDVVDAVEVRQVP